MDDYDIAEYAPVSSRRPFNDRIDAASSSLSSVGERRTAKMSGEAKQFPCAQCGASLRFSPTEQQLICGHCGHRHAITPPEHWPDGKAPELSYADALASSIATTAIEETKTVRCDECGATTDFDENIHAAECVFCASPIVADTGVHRHFKPQGVLPFALTEKEAKQALDRWLKSLWFAPSDVVEFARSDRSITGVYMPFWTFDADTRSYYRGERGDVYYVTRSQVVFRDGKQTRIQRQVPKVRWSPVSGLVRRAFDDVLIIASRALPQRFIDRLNGDRVGWDLHDLQPYSPELLAGFRSEAYSTDLEEGYHAARAVMDLQIRRDVRFDIGGDRQRVGAIDTTVKDVSFKHILLPVWVAAYRYRNQSFRFVVNGRTGEVTGDRPYSTSKIALTVIGAALSFLLLAAAFSELGVLTGG